MTEKLLQYIWQFQYFNRGSLTTTDGEIIQVIVPGALNKNQGPDFFNAKIKIGNTVLAGTIELHIKTSEWKKHGHHFDNNYRNVILHVVYQNDEDFSGAVPVLELQSRISLMMLQHYDGLMSSTSFIACADNIHLVKEITWLSWKERLLAERLSRKAERVLELLKQSHNHWEEVFWWLLARNFGASVNAEAFESMAQTISVNILAKHKASIHQLEALLLGQAGLLKNSFEEEYPKLLQREYLFLKKKYELHPSVMPVHFLRMRPQNFPTVRLAQLAMLVQQSTHLFSKILEIEDIVVLREWLAVTANDYWHYHYRFDHSAAFRKKTIGSSSVNSIIINTISPALFAYGLYHKQENMKAKAMAWLEQTSSELNVVTKGFSSLSVIHKTAYDSQALLELKNEYCTKKRCLDCSVGHYLLKLNANN